MNIAIHNFYHLPQLLSRGGIHNYVLELIKQGKIKYLYFDDRYFKNIYRAPMTATFNQIRSLYSWQDLGLDKTEIIFSSKVLNNKVDVLLNFNGVVDNDLTNSVKNFNGLKIFHIMDYFWIQPGSIQYKKLNDLGVNYLMSYGSPDKYCGYFQKNYPDFVGKVIPVPFGFAPRFKNITLFEKRIQKCIALGSINPLKRPDAPEPFWIEPANYFINEKWMHKFRRILLENKKPLASIMDSLLPVYPHVADHKYDIVQVLNNYQMFTSCESIYYFPTAKSFEGPAAGSVQVCSDHPCFSDIGFKDGVNCIKHKEYNVKDFKEKVDYYLKHQAKLKKIQENGTKFVREYYSHSAVANNLYNAVEKIYNQWENASSSNIRSNPKLDLDSKKVWINPYVNSSQNLKYTQSITVKIKNYLIVYLLIIFSFMHIKILGPLWSFIFTRMQK